MKFRLESKITDEQRAFLDEHGYLHFEGVLSLREVELARFEIDRVEGRLLAERRTHVNGIPLFFGAGRIQRLAFTSLFSKPIARLVREARFEPIRTLVGQDARVGEREKDGVVVNRFLNTPGSAVPRLGWHTDGLRDLFYLRMPQQMLNVGLHLDDCDAENGGLRLLPGTHRQGFLSMCFRKPYFVWHRPDRREIAIETKAGDLTVHDGRLWHRVARSRRTGPASLRRSMYVPYLTGPYEPKTEASRTPAYHRLGAVMRAARRMRVALLLALAMLLFARTALAAGYWNFDKGVSSFARGGANIAAPEDPIAIYTNPAALAALDGVRMMVDADAAWDDRRFTRAPDHTTYEAVQNDSPELPPSPGLFATWRVRRVTLGAAMFGPPRSDVRYPADGPQRYQLIESHNLQIHAALSAAYELPWRKLRVGMTAMSVNQVIRTRLAFNTFQGGPEEAGWDVTADVKARHERIPTAAFGVSLEALPRVTLAASGQLPWRVCAKGRVTGTLGDALDEEASLQAGRVTVKTRLPAIARVAARLDGDRGDVEAAFVYETWSMNDSIRFEPDGLRLRMDEGYSISIGTVIVPTHLRDAWSIRLGGERDAGPLTLRGGAFFERAAIAPQHLSASAFDLDKLGLTAGARVPLSERAWLDLAAGYEHWIPVESRESRVRIVDPLARESRWPVANGRYENTRVVAMAAAGMKF